MDINALNTAFVQGGVFIHVEKGQTAEHPVYIYNITDAGQANVFSQPRSLVHIGENAQVQMVETYVTIGARKLYQPGNGNRCRKRCDGRIL